MQFLGFINKLYNKKISAKGLAVFRICFALNLFFEVNRIFRYRQLYTDPIPFISEASINITIPLLLWMFVLVFIVFGLYTRVMCILNYILALVLFNHLSFFEYHMDYSYLGIGFLMMLIPLSNTYSIDNLRNKLKYSYTQKLFAPKEKITVLYYYVIIFFGVAIVYFDSVFFKFQNNTWLNGLGMWLPASLPQITILNNQWLLNQEYIIKGLGYLTFAFEIVFPFVFFIKRFRFILFVIGIGLHLGILLEFPIPFFALGVAAIYMLMLPVGLWDKLERKIKFNKTRLDVFYDEQNSLSLKIKIILEHFDAFGALKFNIIKLNSSSLEKFNKSKFPYNIYVIDKKGNNYSGGDAYMKIIKKVPSLYPILLLFYIPGFNNMVYKRYEKSVKKKEKELCVGSDCSKNTVRLSSFSVANNKLELFLFKSLIVIFVFFQVNVSFNFPLSAPIVKEIRKNYVKLHEPLKVAELVKFKLRLFSTYFFGIARHGVFVDSHFRNYNKIVTIKYKNSFLPIYNNNGMPSDYLLGGSWINYTYRVSGPDVLKKPRKLKKGLVRYAAFYANKNNIDLNNAEFEIMVKDIKVTFNWEKNLLKNNIDSPWQQIGTITWHNKEARVSLNKNE